MEVQLQYNESKITVPLKYNDNTMKVQGQYHESKMTVPWKYNDSTTKEP